MDEPISLPSAAAWACADAVRDAEWRSGLRGWIRADVLIPGAPTVAAVLLLQSEFLISENSFFPKNRVNLAGQGGVLIDEPFDQALHYANLF